MSEKNHDCEPCSGVLTHSHSTYEPGTFRRRAGTIYNSLPRDAMKSVYIFLFYKSSLQLSLPTSRQTVRSRRYTEKNVFVGSVPNSIPAVPTEGSS